jgi:hypothetical protein
MDVNLKGAFFLIQEMARRMLSICRRSYRSIHVITSVSAEMVSIRPGGILHLQGRGRHDGAGASPRVGARRHRRVRAAPRHHPTPMTEPVADRYDARIAEGSGAVGPLGGAVGHRQGGRARSRVAISLRHRRGHPRGWRPVHPAFVRGLWQKAYDFIIIGGGSAGCVAGRAADGRSGRPASACWRRAGATGTRSTTCPQASPR